MNRRVPFQKWRKTRGTNSNMKDYLFYFLVFFKNENYRHSPQTYVTPVRKRTGSVLGRTYPLPPLPPPPPPPLQAELPLRRQGDPPVLRVCSTPRPRPSKPRPPVAPASASSRPGYVPPRASHRLFTVKRKLTRNERNERKLNEKRNEPNQTKIKNPVQKLAFLK